MHKSFYGVIIFLFFSLFAGEELLKSSVRVEEGRTGGSWQKKIFGKLAKKTEAIEDAESEIETSDADEVAEPQKKRVEIEVKPVLKERRKSARRKRLLKKTPIAKEMQDEDVASKSDKRDKLTSDKEPEVEETRDKDVTKPALPDMEEEKEPVQKPEEPEERTKVIKDQEEKQKKRLKEREKQRRKMRNRKF